MPWNVKVQAWNSQKLFISTTITVNLTRVADTLCFLIHTVIAGLGFVAWTTFSTDQTFEAQFFARRISS
jgi:hypothetical protein